jgi:hypothetical protein
MTHAQRLREISFDLYERYILLERIAQLFRPDRTPYRVLDVGGHTEAFWPGFPSLAGAVIPDASVAVVDTMCDRRAAKLRPGQRRRTCRSATADLRSGVFARYARTYPRRTCRPAFVAELLRVTRDGLYLAFPFDSTSNRWAESVVVEYTNVLLNDSHYRLCWNTVNLACPDRDSPLRRYSFARSTFLDRLLGQGNTDVWLLMMLTYHSLRTPGTDFVQELNSRFNQVYAGAGLGRAYITAPVFCFLNAGACCRIWTWRCERIVCIH